MKGFGLRIQGADVRVKNLELTNHGVRVKGILNPVFGARVPLKDWPEAHCQSLIFENGEKCFIPVR